MDIKICILLTILLTGCASNKTPVTTSSRYLLTHDRAPKQDKRTLDFDKIPNPTPQYVSVSKYGNPKSYKINNKEYKVLSNTSGYKKRGIASWYGEKFHGHRTSSGETYDMYQLTAAHPHLPIPCFAKITNLTNGKSIIAKINDRGPFHDNRLIDLSYAAAGKLGVLQTGTAAVEVETITPEFSPKFSYYIQLGAFKLKRNADNLLTTISKHLPAKVTVTTEQGMYKVIAGPFLHAQESKEVYELLLKQNIGQALSFIKRL